MLSMATSRLKVVIRACITRSPVPPNLASTPACTWSIPGAHMRERQRKKSHANITRPAISSHEASPRVVQGKLSVTCTELASHRPQQAEWILKTSGFSLCRHDQRTESEAREHQIIAELQSPLERETLPHPICRNTLFEDLVSFLF